MFGTRLQLLGELQVLGFSSPRIRRLSPFGTWLTALPVWIATQSQGSGLAQRADADAGHAVPVFGVYFGRHPKANSSARLLQSGSQSSDWFWLPPTTRSVTIGSFTSRAFCRFGMRPILMTRSWVVPVWKELAQNEPVSHIWASLIGPERASFALKVRWTVPNEPLQGLLPPCVQGWPSTLPPVILSSHFSSTGRGPTPGATEKKSLPVDSHRPLAGTYTSGLVTPSTTAVTRAPTAVGSGTPKSTTALIPIEHVDVADEKYG